MKALIVVLISILAVACFFMGTANLMEGDDTWAAVMYVCFVINVMNATFIATERD